MKLGFHTVSVEIITHSEFQHSAMYGFRVRTRPKIDFFGNLCLPNVTKSTITLSEINFDLQFTSVVAHKISFRLI